jgi:NADH-quinone oxidoreductase subunit H
LEKGCACLVDIWVPVIVAVLMFATLANIVPVMIWVERRGAGFIQNRLGPNVVGPLGLFQPLADAIKLLFKQDATPNNVEFLYYNIAPVLVVLFATLAVASIPFGGQFWVNEQAFYLQVANIPIGLLYLVAVSSFSVYGILMAGWSSRNKYALFGALRASAQMISYEIGLGIGVATMILVFGTFDIREMVNAQSAGVWSWGLIQAPLVFVLFLVTVFAETNRLPFDLAEGEAEIVGYHVEYSSMRFALFFMAEYMHMVIGSAVISCLFLGGWHIPGVNDSDVTHWFVGWGMSESAASLFKVAVQFGVMLLKIAMILWVFVWVRWSLPRFRYDQLMRFGWSGVIPYALVSLGITAFVVYLRVAP